jgi:energy-coupling factor transporter transmembrane protein EcfT
VNPLIIKAMRQALDMGLVMDARAFGAYKTRRWMIKTNEQ